MSAASSRWVRISSVFALSDVNTSFGSIPSTMKHKFSSQSFTLGRANLQKLMSAVGTEVLSRVDGFRVRQCR